MPVRIPVWTQALGASARNVEAKRDRLRGGFRACLTSSSLQLVESAHLPCGHKAKRMRRFGVNAFGFSNSLSRVAGIQRPEPRVTACFFGRVVPVRLN